MGTDLNASLVETHISWVLLSGARAYKILKPIRTDFLDHRDLADRRRACEEEVACNARMAPDVYLGTGSLTFGGEELEPVVVMRRMPADRRLSALLDTPQATDLVRAVARSVATFHERADRIEGPEARELASADGLRRRWADDLAGLRTVADDLDLDGELDQIEHLVHRYLAGREPLLEARIADGLVRDGHGDLLAEDIFCLDDGPRILDALAFDRRLRTIDVLADVAFLVMDLQRLGHPALAVAFLRAYCEFGDEHHPGSLAHLYVAQRALVRAKVAAIRHRQDGTHEAEVRSRIAQSLDHLRRAESRLVLVGGIPGSGKSTLAERLSSEQGWMVLSSDEVRRDLGLRRRDIGNDAYRPETVARVYERLLGEAGELLSRGYSVILDASWSSADARRAARELADAAAARLIELRCEASRELCRSRIRTRDPAHTESEASPDTVDLLADRTDAWPEAMPVDTTEPDERLAPAVTAAALWLRTVPRR